MALMTMFDGKIDFELLFCVNILKLKSLHYGYSENPDDPIRTIADLSEAQDRYSRSLLEWMPPGCTSVLDVGCGTGEIAEKLAELSYNVTAITPCAILHAVNNSRVRFVLSRFESFNTDDRYDLILMSESHNYFHRTVGFKRSRKLLNANGHLLISGIYKKPNAAVLNRTMSTFEDHDREALAHGFERVRMVDITENVVPTIMFAETLYQEYIFPVVNMLCVLTSQSSFLHRSVFQLFFGNHANFRQDFDNVYGRRFNAKSFLEDYSYIRVLYKCAENAA